jgi:excisionase family DNA binding protein
VSGREVTTTGAGCLLGKPLRSQEIADPNELLDIGQAAAFLNVSEASLRRWTNSGRLACLRVGRRRERRFRRQDLIGFLEGQPSDIATRFADVVRASLESVAQTGAEKIGDLSGGPVTVTHGSHLCGLYDTDLGRITLAAPFLLGGLGEGSTCFLVGQLRVRNEILKHLRKKRPSLQADIDAGHLIQSEYQPGLRAQTKYFRELLDERVAQGGQSFRIVGDMWGMRSKVSEESLVGYEADYDRLIARNYPVVTICIYDARKFSGVELLSALKGHRDTFRYPLERALA